MVASVSCPACQKDNTHNRAVCRHCGEPLVSLLSAHSTEQVLQRPAEAMPTRPVPEAPELQGSGIALVIRGYQEPILAQGSPMILGRYDPGFHQPIVDLTPFNAGASGVSRRHACIYYQDGQFLIEDLDSTNGTWINQQRLPAGKKHGLQNGDLIQLGQLVLNIYFGRADALRSVEERISFRIPSANFSPHFLATRVSPYLTALATIQTICDERLRRQASQIEINGIHRDGPMTLTVDMTGAREALRLAKGPLKTWRKENAATINRFLSLTETLYQQTSTLFGEQGAVLASPTGDEAVVRQLGRQLREGEIKVALDFLRQIGAGAVDTNPSHDVERLLKPMHVLAFSPLHVTTDSSRLAH